MKVEVQSGIMNGDEILMLAIVVVIISFIPLIAIAVSVRKGSSKWQKKSTTKKLDDGPPKCDICFDVLDGRTATCRCGKIFHDSCAAPTESCPYCSSPYSEFSIDEPSVRCPKCGRYPFSSHCRCGAFLPDADRFICKCGARIYLDNPKCGKCGSKYVVNNAK